MAELKNDIDRYLRGQMSPAEMHALEKRALNDPFLAEALEGAGTIRGVEFMSDVLELKHRMADKVHTKKRWKVPLRIAASIVLMAITSYTIYRFALPNAESDKLALKSAEKLPESNSAATADSLSEKRKRADAGPLSKEPVLSQPAAPAPKKDVTQQAQSKPVESPSPTTVESESSKAGGLDELAEEAKTEPKQADQKKAKVEVALDDDARDRAVSAGNRSASAPLTLKQQIITGKITDAGNGTPISGASVTTEGAAKEVQSDSNGQFAMILDERPDKLIFSSDGFDTKVVNISAVQTKVDVELPAESSSISEIVLVSYTKLDSVSDKTIRPAQPIGGKKEFDNYIERNLRYPQHARQRKTEGKVTVEFTVKGDGALSDLTIVRGLDSAFNNEAIRLVKEGPSWKPSEQGGIPLESTVLVRINFKLPQ